MAATDGKQKGNSITRVWLSILALAVLGAAAIWIVAESVLPWSGARDRPPVSAQDMTQLALTSVQYVQALCTATFGGAVLAISQRVLGQAQLFSDARRRGLMAFGLVALSLSLVTGFVNVEMIIEAADQGLVHEKLSALRHLRAVQSLFLIGGVVTVGGTLVWDVLFGSRGVR